MAAAVCMRDITDFPELRILRRTGILRRTENSDDSATTVLF